MNSPRREALRVAHLRSARDQRPDQERGVHVLHRDSTFHKNRPDAALTPATASAAAATSTTRTGTPRHSDDPVTVVPVADRRSEGAAVHHGGPPLRHGLLGALYSPWAIVVNFE